jgi:pimeloyl-ACP methyl ester carboxylesterase
MAMRFAVDGHELDYEVRGDGRPIVFLHGLAVDRQVMMAACEPAFENATGWRRVYVDLPGHGASKGDPEHAGADQLVSSLATFLSVATSGDERPLLFGYSYGGYLAQGLLREVETIDGLFLCCPTVEADFGKRNVPPRRVAKRDDFLRFSEDPRERVAFEEVAVLQTAEMLEAFQRVVHPGNIGADQEVMAATRGRYAMSRPYMQALQAFDKPVSIVCGRDDHWVGFEDAIRLARAFRRVQYTVLPDCGHLLPLEQPARFAALLQDWLGVIPR